MEQNTQSPSVTPSVTPSVQDPQSEKKSWTTYTWNLLQRYQFVVGFVFGSLTVVAGHTAYSKYNSNHRHGDCIFQSNSNSTRKTTSTAMNTPAANSNKKNNSMKLNQAANTTKNKSANKNSAPLPPTITGSAYKRK